ncbi:MAG: TonB-dependent receptor [Caulobacteraceae bacterium]|nr:TonB-dependent receptor [Caulobacteraceae bacterium]
MNRHRWLLAVSAAALLAYGAGAQTARAADPTSAATAGASSAGNDTTLSAVVVTARKVTESAQRVPLVVQSFSGRQLSQQGIREPTDLSHNVPGLLVSPAPGKTTGAVFEVRGQTSVDTTLQFGTPIGFYEDGVNIPHPVGANGSFFDLANIQVLKGPQGTLYGRNTTGGAVLVATRDADFNGLHGFAMGEVGNYDDWKLGGAVNLPLIEDKLALRLAVQHWNRNGFGRSGITGQHLGDSRDDTVVRGRIKFSPTASFTSDTSVEYGYLNHTNDLIIANGYDALVPNGAVICNPAVAAGCGPAQAYATAHSEPLILFPLLSQPSPGVYVPFVNSVNGNPFFQAGAQNPQAAITGQLGPASLYNLGHYVGTGVNGASFPTSDKVKTLHIGETITANIGDIATFKSITGFHYFQDFSQFDLSGIPGNTLAVGVPILGPNGVPIAPLTTSLSGPDQSDQQLTQEFDLNGKWNGLSWLVGGFLSWDHGANEQWSSVTTALGPTTFNTYFTPHVSTNTWAIFSQEDYKITDWFSITGGLRYTHEAENETAAQFLYTPLLTNLTGKPYLCLTGPTPFASAASPYACMVRQNTLGLVPGTATLVPTMHAASNAWSYLLSFNFQITPDMLLYFKTAKGTHGGVLQGRAFSFAPAYPESATDYEIGFKGEFLDHRLRVDTAGYITHYANKQETIITGAPPTTVLFNATTANIKGWEAEVDALPIEGLRLSATVGYTYGKFGKFFPATLLGSTPAAFGGVPSYVNATGSPFAEVPPWSYSLEGNYHIEAGPGTLTADLNWSWRSHLPSNPYLYEVDPTFNQTLFQSFRQAVGLLNANISYTVRDWGTTFEFFGTNLLNHHYQVVGVAAQIDGIEAGVAQDPQMFGFRVTKTFGRE